MKTIIILSATAFLLCAFQASTTSARTWHILPDGSGDAPTVQEGLDMCAAEDTVLVAPGTYYENIIWPAVSAIILRSESGADVTVIDGGEIGRVITITTGVSVTTRIDGFTIRNGRADVAGGISCNSSSSPTIINNIITENTATSIMGAGGIGFANDSSPIIIYNTISMNTSTNGAGGGIGGGPDCSPMIDSNTITGNTAATAGGGIILWNHCGGTISGNTIKENESGTAGGGISCNVDASVTIANNTIINNVAGTRGGGIDFSHRDSSFVYCNTIEGNTAPDGAGICCRDEAGTIISYCDILNNYGDGVLCMRGPGNSANPIINYNNIVNNTGDGVLNSDSDVTVDATNNWWGDPSGPGGEGPGLGDEVSLYVAYDPWGIDPFVGCPIAGIGSQVSPVRNLLLQNYPNPFNPTTRIKFDLPKSERVNLRIYDVSGRLVRILVNGELVDAGRREVVWRGRDETGLQVASGVYFYRLEAGEYSETEKMVLQK